MKLIQRSDDHNNPWGKKPQKEGPPDFEALIKGFFSKKKSSGGGNTPSASNTPINFKLFLPIIVIILTAAWALSGIYVVQPAEKAAVLRFGKYVETVNPGMHWYPRFIERVIKVNVDKVDTIKIDKEMLTSKENIVHVSFTAQYHVGNVEKYLFNVVNPVNTLSQALDSAVRQTIGQNQLEKILTTSRSEITREVQKELVELLKSYETGIAVNEVVMQPAQAPDAVKSAFDDVIKAREDREKAQNVAESYANRVIPVARGKAQRLLDEANAYKQEVELQAQAQVARFNALLPAYKRDPSIVQSQLYFDTMQSVLADSKVFVVDGDGAKNLFYWPGDSIPSSIKRAISGADTNQHHVSSVATHHQSSDSPNMLSKKNVMTREQYMRWLEANQ